MMTNRHVLNILPAPSSLEAKRDRERVCDMKCAFCLLLLAKIMKTVNSHLRKVRGPLLLMAVPYFFFFLLTACGNCSIKGIALIVWKENQQICFKAKEMLGNCQDIFSSGMQQVLFVRLVSGKFLMQQLIRVNKCLHIS